MESRNTTSSERSLTKKLADHQHRLVSLQVSLQEAYRQGTIAQKDYQIRANKLSDSLQLLRQLNAWTSADEVALTQETNLGLPDLEHCTPEEKRICYDFLRQRQETLEQLVRESAKILDWCESACYGKTFFLRYVFQLSKLRRLISEADAALNGLALEDLEADRLTVTLGQSLSSGRSTGLKANLEAIMKLFNTLDETSARLAELRNKVRDEEIQLQQMKNWLNHERNALAEPLEFTPPPTTEDKILTAPIPVPAARQYIQKTDRRLQLAKQYIETCIQQTQLENDTPPESRETTMRTHRPVAAHLEYPRPPHASFAKVDKPYIGKRGKK